MVGPHATTTPRRGGGSARRAGPICASNRHQHPGLSPLPGWVQLELFPGVRDLDRFDRRRDANLTNPALVRARHEARTIGEARGWAKVMAGNVDRALVIALSGHTQGELISHSQLSPTLRRRGLTIARTVEVLERLGLFTDDRIPSFDTWLAGKLRDLAPGIGNVVEGWARQLHDGGPRNRRHPQTTRPGCRRRPRVAPAPLGPAEPPHRRCGQPAAKRLRAVPPVAPGPPGSAGIPRYCGSPGGTGPASSRPPGRGTPGSPGRARRAATQGSRHASSLGDSPIRTR